MITYEFDLSVGKRVYVWFKIDVHTREQTFDFYGRCAKDYHKYTYEIHEIPKTNLFSHWNRKKHFIWTKICYLPLPRY